MDPELKLTIDNLENNVLCIKDGVLEIRGTLEANLHESVMVNYVKVVFEGETKSKVSYQNDEGIQYQEYEEEIIKASCDLLHDKGSAQPLPGGLHQFPFHIHVPNPHRELISSFSLPFSSVKYQLVGKVDVVGKDKKVEIPVVVLNHPVTNQPVFMREMRLSDQKMICCLCCAEGPVAIDATINRMSGSVGGTIHLVVKANNSSKKEAKPEWKLYQTVITGMGHVSQAFDVVAKDSGHKIKCGETDGKWETEIKIPANLPPTVISSQNIKVSYTLQVSMDIENAFDLHLTFPLLIGLDRP